MSIVTDIENRRGRYEIRLDGILWLRIPTRHFNRLPIECGEEIDAEQYMDRMAAIQSAECYEAALCVLDASAQTKSGMLKSLMRKGYVRPAAESAVQRLSEIGLIDDRRYAERIAQSQLKKPVGAFAVRQKLRAKQISTDDIDSVMDGFDDAQQAAACREAAEKLIRKYRALPPRDQRVKLSQALARRGFAWDAISPAVSAAIGCEEDES